MTRAQVLFRRQCIFLEAKSAKIAFSGCGGDEGVSKDATNSMKAHAWIRCGEYYLTEKAGSEQYTVTAYFS